MVNEQVAWEMAGFAVIAVNLWLVHKLTANFEKWLNPRPVK